MIDAEKAGLIGPIVSTPHLPVEDLILTADTFDYKSVTERFIDRWRDAIGENGTLRPKKTFSDSSTVSMSLTSQQISRMKAMGKSTNRTRHSTLRLQII